MLPLFILKLFHLVLYFSLPFHSQVVFCSDVILISIKGKVSLNLCMTVGFFSLDKLKCVYHGAQCCIY